MAPLLSAALATVLLSHFQTYVDISSDPTTKKSE